MSTLTNSGKMPHAGHCICLATWAGRSKSERKYVLLIQEHQAGADGQRTVMTTESDSACQEWSIPGPHVT